MVNAAASHVAEQDDVHNGSVFHPATVVFPVALAWAQALGASGRQLLTAAVAGYEVGIRVGEFLGRSHYKVFHTTGTAGTLAAAATAGHLLGLDAGAHAARLRLGRHAGRGPVGVPAHRRRFEAAAHRACGRGRPDGRVAWRATASPARSRSSKGAQGLAAGMSTRRRSGAAGRRPGHALGAGRDLLQVPRLVPPHASRGRRAAGRSMQAHDLRADDIAEVHDARAPGRDRRAGAGGRPGHGAPVEVLDGHGARHWSRASARPGWPSSTRTSATTRPAPSATGSRMALDAEVDAAYPRALDRQGDGAHARRPRARRPRGRARRATRATRSAATRSRPRRCASRPSAAARTRPRMRDAIGALWRVADATDASGRCWVPQA